MTTEYIKTKFIELSALAQKDPEAFYSRRWALYDEYIDWVCDEYPSQHEIISVGMEMRKIRDIKSSW